MPQEISVGLTTLSPYTSLSLKCFESQLNFPSRRLFALQLKKDLLEGELNCGENTAALLTAFILQAELGDREEEERRILSYLENIRLSKQYSPAFISKVVDLHSNLEGMSRGEADYRLLDSARKLEFYGLKLHPARENGGILLNLGVTHAGLFLYQGKTKLNHFSWSKIRKLSFKRTKFLIKLHPGTESFGKDTIEFNFDSRDACKNFWKKCLEHHAFFRSREMRGEPGAGGGGLGGFGTGMWASTTPPAHPYASQPSLGFVEDAGRKGSTGCSSGSGRLSRSGSLKSSKSQGLFSKGSSYRYCGRTQQQLIESSHIPNAVTISSEKRSKSVGRLGSTQNLNRFGPPHLRRSVTRVDDKHEDDIPRILQHQCLFRGSSSSMVAADFSLPSTSLPDHYQLLYLSTPIRRPLSTRYSAGSAHSVDQASLPPESPCKIGSQLLESEYGANVPRVFSANVVKAPRRKRDSGSRINTASDVTVVASRASDVEPFAKCLSICWDTGSIGFQRSLVSKPPSDHTHVPSESNDGKSTHGTKHLVKSNGISTAPNDTMQAFSSPAVSVSDVLLHNETETISTTDAYDIHNHGHRTRASSAIEDQSHYSISLPPENYDEVAEDEDDNDISDDRAIISDDSLLQYPLSVCASGAVSSNDLYRSGSVDFHYPICTLENLHSPLYQENENGNRTINLPILSSYSPDKVDSRAFPCYPSKSAPTSRRASNYSTHGEAFDEEDCTERKAYSLAPALSIGAISAITGVSCFDDEDSESGGGDGEGVNTYNEGQTEATSLISGPSSTAVDTPSSLVVQRAQSEPLRPPPSMPEGSHSATSHSITPRRQLLKRKRTRKREMKPKLSYLNYSTVSAAFKRYPCALATSASFKMLRKKPLPPYHDRTFHLTKELSITEKTYVNSLRLLLMPCETDTAPEDNSHPHIVHLIKPLYCHHLALLQSALARVVAWEKAAVNAAEARTRFQSALVDAQRAQRIKRKQAARQIQSNQIRKPQRSKRLVRGSGCDDDLDGNNDLSESSTSVSGVPRSSSRNELPPSIESNRNWTPPAEGCNLTASSTSCSSFTSSTEVTDTEKLSRQSAPSSLDLKPAERELRETTRCLVELARIADVYRPILLDLTISFYENFLTSLPDLLNRYTLCSMRNDVSDCVTSYPSRLALLRVPARRLWYYNQTFKLLGELYGDEHPDFDDSNALVSRLSDLASRFDSVYRTTEAYALVAQFCQSYELNVPDRSNVGEGHRRRACSVAMLNSLVNEPHSCLIRVGFLEKMSSRGRGFQPRMALLFSDRLVYCGRVSGSANIQLKIHGVVSLHNAGLESHIKTSVSFSEGISQGSNVACQPSNDERDSFAILVFSGKRVEKGHSTSKSLHNRTHRVVFAAPNKEQKQLWLNALNSILGREKWGDKSVVCANPPSPSLQGITRHDHSGGDNKPQVSSSLQNAPPDPVYSTRDHQHLGLLGPRSHLHQTILRCSGLAYVCWHRRLSVSLDNILNANQCELSGYLLRKFKSSCGWQRLWTVFTDFTLFFYKSPDDFAPIASLPLLGYHLESIRSAVAPCDAQLHKSDVLQLTYRSHIYYFRTDTAVSFERWYNALSSALNPLSAGNK